MRRRVDAVALGAVPDRPGDGCVRPVTQRKSASLAYEPAGFPCAEPRLARSRPLRKWTWSSPTSRSVALAMISSTVY